MPQYFVSMGNAVVDRSPDELIGAVIVALALSLAMAGLYCIARRKANENLLPIIGLMIVANLLSMVVGMGYVAHARKAPSGIRPGIPFVPEAALIEAIFETADKNGDGMLSSEEASQGAERFVQGADASGTGLVDPQSLRRAILDAELDRYHTFDHPRERFGRGPSRRMRRALPEPQIEEFLESGSMQTVPDAKEIAAGSNGTQTPESPARESHLRENEVKGVRENVAKGAAGTDRSAH